MKLTVSSAVVFMAFAMICLIAPANGRPRPKRCQSNSVEVSPCLPGWVLNNGSCYYFSDTVDTWESARNACAALSVYGGNDAFLLEIHDQNEQDFIASIILERRSLENVLIHWTGLSDLETEDVFVWTGSGRNVSFTNWADSPFGSDTDCIVIFFNGYWYDVSCDERVHYICEMEAAYY